MALAGRRPQRRRRRWLLLALLITLVVLAVNAAVSSRSSGPAARQASLAYLDSVRPLVDRSNQQGADLSDLRNQAIGLGRDGIDRRLDRVSRNAEELLREGRQLRPPPADGDAHELFIAALAIRAKAASGLRQAFTESLGTEPAADAVAALVGQGRTMNAGDQAYALFAAALPAVPGAGALPASQWITDQEAWTEPLLATFVASLRSSAALSPVHDLSVVLVSLEPAAVGTEGPMAILPQARNLKLQIVV